MVFAASTIEKLTRARHWVQSPVRAVLLLGTIAASMVLIATEIYLLDLRRHEIRHAAEEASSVSQIIGDQTARALQGVDLVVSGVAERVGSLEKDQLFASDFLIHTMLKARIGGMPHIGALFLVDAEGKVINTSTDFPIPQVEVADRDYFQFHRSHKKGEVLVGRPLVNRMGGQWTVHISRRIERDDGQFAGVVVAALNLDYFEQLHNLKLHYISPVALYLKDGRLLTRTPRDEEMIGRAFPLPASPAGSTDSLRSERIDGDAPGVVVYRDIAEFPLTLAVSSLDAAALTDWRRNAFTLWVSAGAMASFIALITLLLVRELKREQFLADNLAQTGETLRALVDTAMDAIVTVDMEQRVVLFNPAAEKMFACTASEAIGAPLARFLPERYRSAHERHVGGFHESRTPSRAIRGDVVGLRAGGEEFPVESTISQVTVGGRTLFTAVLHDISERRRAEATLRATTTELRRLSESLIMVRESERSRIARELHDELGQHLMRLRLDLSSLAEHLRSSHPELQGKVNVMKGLLADTVSSVRRITTELRPLLLDDLGLVAAAEWLSNDFSQRSGIAVDVDIDPAADECAADMATAAYRILQEALTNVARHASASQVSVTLQLEDEVLCLAIEDNGRGMQPSASPMFRAGNGLVGMRERVLMFGGQLELGRSASGGVAIDVQLPLKHLPAAS
ncbi:PAS domain S-box protein [Rhodoferax sp.]|uniref:PAS domain S-box protein n=1 Tax=Rhodoferax sp. TaxID=50421 RepID=UPI00275355B1|nr:PAS domain S-box protein [Rhodoferax sp.]